MEVPYKMLSAEALNGVVKEFVLREGTDYGHFDYDIEKKITQVLNQIISGRAKVVYDHESDSCSVLLN